MFLGRLAISWRDAIGMGQLLAGCTCWLSADWAESGGANSAQAACNLHGLALGRLEVMFTS